MCTFELLVGISIKDNLQIIKVSGICLVGFTIITWNLFVLDEPLRTTMMDIDYAIEYP